MSGSHRIAVPLPALVLLLVAVGCDLPIAPAPTPAGTLADGSAAPAAPTGVAATMVSATELTVVWTDASLDETHFQVNRRASVDGVWGVWAVLPSLPADATSFDESGLAPATRYQYRVRACNAAGCSAYVASTGVATGYPPASPASLAGEGVPDEVVLVWPAASGAPTRYDLQRSVRDGTWSAWSPIATLGGGATGHTDGGVTEGSQYRYRIRACNAAGCSAYVVSSPLAAMYGAEAPLNSQLRVISSTRIDVIWEAGSDAQTSFQLRRSVRLADAWGPWELIAMPAGDAVTHADTGLTPGTRYRYRIRACNLARCSHYDEVVSATTPAG
jgi:predicted phage tail protein